MHREVLDEYPAYKIVKPIQGEKLRHGDIIALQWPSRNYGPMWHRYRLGTVAGFAIENGDCPEEEIARCKRQMVEDPHAGHKLYWANACAVTLSNRVSPQETYRGYQWGDEIILQGKTFRLEKTHNQNCKLVAL